jgi:HlyD family secretion protein
MSNPLSFNKLPPVTNIKTSRALPSISPWVIGGGWFMVSTLSLAASLTTVVSYKTLVRAEMIVRPEGELKLVQPSIGGSVVSIQMTDNQKVSKGQILAALDGSKLTTRHEQIKESIAEDQNQIEQIDAQIALLEDQIATEENQLATTIAMVEAELDGRQRSYMDSQTTTSAEVREAQANLQLANEELISYQKLVDRGAIAQLELTQKQTAVEVASAQLDRLTAALNPTDADVTIAQEKIAQTRSQGAITISQLKQTQAQLNQQRSEIKKALKNSLQEQQQVITDLESTQIKAPISGTIQSSSLRNAYQVIQPGETIAKIFPNNAALKVQALIPSKEVSKVQVGQIVKMRISACPFSHFGTLPGVVSTISPDTLSTSERDNSQQSGETFYSVIIQPQSLKLEAGGQACSVQAGTEGRADIITREETVLDFILRKANFTVKK